jgi:hypothetical protein|tara:strand:- start:2499 stop:2678 length:180 start_codon:yes stop_codon:yes gene_type:complete
MSGFIYNLLLVIQEVAMADGMRSEGKIYVVVVVFLLILLALFVYLYRIEKKIDRLNNKK